MLSTSAVLSPNVFVSLAFQFSSLISHKGPDGSLKFSTASLCTCHNLLTPETLHILTMSDASVLTSVDVKPLVESQLLLSKLSAMPVLRSCDSLRPAQFSVYASPTLFTFGSLLNFGSAVGATLDTGDWLNLTRQGLSPCKMHQD